MKKQLLANYTSEILSPNTMPSLRLISLAAHQDSKGEFRWIPRKMRMTEERAADLQIARPQKLPRLEALGLSSLILDEPPALEVGDHNMGISGVQRLLAVHDIALAVVGSAHLARLKAYSNKFIQLLTQRYDSSSGLRPPSTLEAQQADCKLWQRIYALVSDKGWKLNDATYEYTEIRGEMASLLQARAKPAQVQRIIDKGPKGKGLGKSLVEAWRGSQSWKGPGKGPGKDKGDKGGKGKSPSKGFIKGFSYFFCAFIYSDFCSTSHEFISYAFTVFCVKLAQYSITSHFGAIMCIINCVWELA
ncbi:unnamed protein product [Symbiodinium sp. CCMP2456]|nr:unnamed protein product [Symbiodinium sp. CCMP2456]